MQQHGIHFFTDAPRSPSADRKITDLSNNSAISLRSHSSQGLQHRGKGATEGDVESLLNRPTLVARSRRESIALFNSMMNS